MLSNNQIRTIGISGTNGKSTTTALLGHILEKTGRDPVVYNDAKALTIDLDIDLEGKCLVAHISSSQAELYKGFLPDVAVMTNLTDEYADRYGGMEHYLNLKTQNFEGKGFAIIGVDDEWCKKIYKEAEHNLIGERECFAISMDKKIKRGIYVEDNRLYDMMQLENIDDRAIDEEGYQLRFPHLAGKHNQQNIAAAYACARLMGCVPDDILSAVETFRGLPHRQYLASVLNGVAYVNDSKATNASAAACALESYNNIYWIVGGSPKEDGLSGLEKFMPRVREAFLIGQSMDEFAKWLDNQGVEHHFSGTLKQALEHAHELAQQARGEPGGTGTVLLSPACASFDQFENFEERGNHFVQLVQDLEQQVLSQDKE